MTTLRINWLWIQHRAATTMRCRHRWMDGDNTGRKACEQCGVWRWFPIWRRNTGMKEPR